MFNQKEYLYQLKNYSSISHIGEFLANEIEAIITEVDFKKFCVIVTDSELNYHITREIISIKFSYISNIFYITH